MLVNLPGRPRRNPAGTTLGSGGGARTTSLTPCPPCPLPPLSTKFLHARIPSPSWQNAKDTRGKWYKSVHGGEAWTRTAVRGEGGGPPPWLIYMTSKRRELAGSKRCFGVCRPGRGGGWRSTLRGKVGDLVNKVIFLPRAPRLPPLSFYEWGIDGCGFCSAPPLPSAGDGRSCMNRGGQ